ncbi:hypothetical protein [Actinokineospora sp. NBRC 105648]|uniref:hypothetical protein n=1 Tax=Actinokineospora sp. NBRC 105648 TaxID=3032206 RepID=UPI0025560483|nr:hypothetical protein [Actinokineospora sp. NBRC 105648]
MSYAYALVKRRGEGQYRWPERIQLDRCAEATIGELVVGLRDWASEQLHAAISTDNGEYTAYLVALTVGDDFDPDEALHQENLVWFHGCEHVPVNT